MITITKTLQEQPDDTCLWGLFTYLNQNGPDLKNKILYFDIETTGFSAKGTVCYLIGAVFYQEQKWQYTQWFAQTPAQEPEILHAFFDFARDFYFLLHFNGDGFDLPYLNGRCSQLGIDCPLSELKSIDLYKQVRTAHKLLKLDNYKQKTLEQFLGLTRRDLFSGGDLIRVYQKYVADTLLHENTEEALALLLLHNQEDICALPFLTAMAGYALICSMPCGSLSVQIQDAKDYAGLPVKEAVFMLKLPAVLPVPVSYGKEPFYLKAFDSTVRLRVRMHTGELKYFYPNYRDYYYLPQEDRSIHKSVAFYVDKNFRTQAKAANCYSKKSGMFLPQPHSIEKPYFKIDYYDSMTYFEAEAAFFKDPARQLNYMRQIAGFLL